MPQHPLFLSYLRPLAAFGLAAVSLTACGPKHHGSPDAPVQGPLSLTEGGELFATDVEPLLVANCSGCHSAGSHIPPLFVNDPAAFRANGPAIIASLQPTAAKRMPFHHRPLTAAEEGSLKRFLALPDGPTVAAPTPKSAYERDVLPILVKACGACHTPGSNILPVFVVADEQPFLKLKAGILASLVAPANRGRMPPPRLRGGLTAAEEATLKNFGPTP